MKNIITLIESELHRRALQTIDEEKQGVAKKAFDVPGLNSADDEADEDEPVEECDEEMPAFLKKKLGKEDEADDGDADEDEDKDEDKDVDEEESRAIQVRNIQGKRRETETARLQ